MSASFIRYFVCVILILLLTFVSCSRQNNSFDTSAQKIKVVATVGMITDAVKNIGGERVEVGGLMGPGVDPHLYKASARDLGRMFDADIIFYIGLHLEGKMADLFEKMQERGKKTVAVSDGIERSILLASSQFQTTYDPHIWFDVELWMKAIEIIRDSLCQIDPEYSMLYNQNAQRYLSSLIHLHEYVRMMAQKVPHEQRVLITAHDAFNYFGNAYGFEVKGLQGISTAAEAGTGDLRELADFIVKRRIPAIFIESSIPVRNIEAVKAAVRSRGFQIEIGGELFSDAMGSEGTEEGTYIGMVRHNIDVIVGSLLRDNGEPGMNNDGK